MSKSLSLLLYNLLLPVGLVFMLPGALRKMRARGGRWQDMAQRFGFLSEAKRAAITQLPNGRNRIWLHAVSVGEIGIATKLITRLLKDSPKTGIVLTTTTPTGYALAEEFAQKTGRAVQGTLTKKRKAADSAAPRVVVLYSPIDLPLVGARFLDLIQPTQIVLVEAEVWPNLVAAAHRRGTPVSMVNARLSLRSEARFQQFGFFIRPVFAMLDQVLVQERGDVARFAALGVDVARIQHIGSIKFDPQGADADEAQLRQLRGVLQQFGISETQSILLLASTHRGEEVLLAEVYLKLQEKYPDLVLLVVPRHVERATEIIEALQALGITTVRRSQLNGSRPAASGSRPALLIDTTGELRAWQCLATAVVVGKSFLSEGGQNPAEAVMALKPVLFGPHMENFEALVDLLLKHEGAIQVPDTTRLEVELSRLLIDPVLREHYGQAGHAALATHEGATAKTVARLLPK